MKRWLFWRQTTSHRHKKRRLDGLTQSIATAFAGGLLPLGQTDSPSTEALRPGDHIHEGSKAPDPEMPRNS